MRLRDYTAAYNLLLPLAESGNDEAQYQLAALYRTGHGIDADYKQAFHWLLRSAEQGHPKAQYNLAKMYEKGWGTDSNNEQATIWYTKAADSGHILAQTWLKNQTTTLQSPHPVQHIMIRALPWWNRFGAWVPVP